MSGKKRAMKTFTLTFLFLAGAGHALAQGTASAPLQLEAKIPLGKV